MPPLAVKLTEPHPVVVPLMLAVGLLLIVTAVVVVNVEQPPGVTLYVIV